MRKITLISTVVILVLSAGIVFAQMSNSGGMMGGAEKSGMMMNENMMNGPMMSGMNMGGMDMQMIATEDGGIVVMCMGKLYKYDNDLKLIKEVERPMDFEYMKKMHTGMMEEMKGTMSKEPEK